MKKEKLIKDILELTEEQINELIVLLIENGLAENKEV